MAELLLAGYILLNSDGNVGVEKLKWEAVAEGMTDRA